MMWKFLGGGATVIPGATFIPESRVGADYSFDIKSGFSIAPAFFLHNNFDIASVYAERTVL